MLGELERNGRVVVFDMEAGVGTLLRLQPGQADVVLLIAEPTAKSIEVARRAAEISEGRARVIIVANKVRDDADVERIRAALGGHQLVVVPEDEAIARADRDGLAPIDVDPQAAGVQAVVELAGQLRSAP
ncbi:MAG: hypothetical protein H0V68_10470 [Actinobacteria bacterium]|nr:hypothetical protein [Actinomycetota bacterium]